MTKIFQQIDTWAKDSISDIIPPEVFENADLLKQEFLKDGTTTDANAEIVISDLREEFRDLPVTAQTDIVDFLKKAQALKKNRSRFRDFGRAAHYLWFRFTIELSDRKKTVHSQTKLNC